MLALDEMDFLIRHLVGCGISSVISPNSDESFDSLQNYLENASIELAVDSNSFTKSTPDSNYSQISRLFLDKIFEKDFVNWVSKQFSSESNESLTVRIIPQSTMKTRDEYVRDLFGSQSQITWRVFNLPLEADGIWITLSKRHPFFILSSGESMEGKTTLAHSLTNGHFQFLNISGDTVLEKIARGKISVSAQLLKICKSGYEVTDWSKSIRSISNDLNMTEEFSELLLRLSFRHDTIFEMWCPPELALAIRIEFQISGFHVWNMEKFKLEIKPQKFGRKYRRERRI